MKIKSSLILGPAWRKRWTLAAERCKTSVAVIKQALVVGESPAAKELKVSVLGIDTLHRNVDPLGDAVLAAEKTDDLDRRKRGNWIGVAWKDVFADFEVVIAGLVEAHKIACGIGKMVAHVSCREVSIEVGDLVQPI